MTQPKVALVHDWLNQIGGAEDVLDVLKGMYPEAPIYTSMYWPEKMPAHYRDWEIHTTWMDKLPGIYKRHQLYLPFYPYGFNHDVGDADVILSNKSGFCIGIPKPAGTQHVCYCLTPSRYVFDLSGYLARERMPSIVNTILSPWAKAMQRWELRAANNVDHFIAISKAIQKRIKTHYGRDSIIIYPPVETERFKPLSKPKDYFLVVSRLIPYKRIDLAVEACSTLGIPLKVAGSGRDRERLEALAGPSVEFLGYVPDEDLPTLMAECKAFLFPGLEDFGITPVQAMAAGRPVIAFNGGGAPDYVIPGLSGQLFDVQSVDCLMDSLRDFTDDYDSAAIREHALKFDRSIFEQQLSDFIEAISN